MKDPKTTYLIVVVPRADRKITLRFVDRDVAHKFTDEVRQRADTMLAYPNTYETDFASPVEHESVEQAMKTLDQWYR